MGGEGCHSTDIDIEASSGPMATVQSPWTPSSNRLTRSAAAEDTAVEADNCQRQQRSQPDGHAAKGLQRRVLHHDPRQRLVLDNPEDTRAPPGTQMARSLFGEPLSRTRLDSVFIREQQEVCECRATCDFLLGSAHTRLVHIRMS